LHGPPNSEQSESDFYNFVDVPAMYELLSASIDDPPITILSRTQLEETGNILCTALDTRSENGWRRPLCDLPVTELLSRFTKVAFFVHRDEYIHNDINSPENILSMPITADKVAKIEIKPGPLPTDVKEIALIADDFCGG
jgi:hypothetical protein